MQSTSLMSSLNCSMRSRRKGTHSVGDIIIHFKLEQRISRFIEQSLPPCLQVYAYRYAYLIWQYSSTFRLVNMSQEHGCVSVKSGKIDCTAYPLGSMLFIYPYHVSYFNNEINVIKNQNYYT